MMQKSLFLTVVLGWIVLSGPSVTQAESWRFTPSMQVEYKGQGSQVAPQSARLGEWSAPSLGSFALNILSTVDVNLNVQVENDIDLVLRPGSAALENLSVILKTLSVASVETLTTVTLTLAGLTPGNTGISLPSPSGGLVDASGNSPSVNSRPPGGVTVTPEPGTFVLLGTFLVFGGLFAWRFRKRDA
jgi:hypothetical protein